MSIEQIYENEDLQYGAEREANYRQASRPSSKKAARPAQGRKRGKTPSSFNGMHRRRRRKMAW